MKLTKNFTLDELWRSSTADRLGINNEPHGSYIENLKELCENVLQPLRDYFDLPVSINSGFRCHDLNERIGGAKNSQHLYGEAADIRIIGVANDIVWQYINDNLRFDQLILERVSARNSHRGWVHVSYREPCRMQALSSPHNGLYIAGLHYAN